MVDVPLDQVGGHLRCAEMPKEGLKVGLPTRLLIRDALIAVVRMPQEEIVHQLFHPGVFAARSRKTDRVFCQFPANKRLSLALGAIPGGAALTLAADDNLVRPDLTAGLHVERTSSPLTLHRRSSCCQRTLRGIIRSGVRYFILKSPSLQGPFPPLDPVIEVLNVE